MRQLLFHWLQRLCLCRRRICSGVLYVLFHTNFYGSITSFTQTAATTFPVVPPMPVHRTVTWLVLVTLANSAVLATDWIYSGAGSNLPPHPSWSLALATGRCLDATSTFLYVKDGSRANPNSCQRLSNTSITIRD